MKVSDKRIEQAAVGVIWLICAHHFLKPLSWGGKLFVLAVVFVVWDAWDLRQKRKKGKK